MKVGIFRDCNNLCYGTLNYFSEQLGNALTTYGISVSYLDCISNESLKESFNLLIGFNLLALSGTKVEEEYILDKYGCPFVHFIVDPPYYYHECLQSQMKNQYCVFLDTGHVEYYKQYCAPCKNITTGYLLGPVGNTIPFIDREIDILYTCGFHDRIPTAMLNKSICLTDSSSYIDEHFQNGHDIVLYQLNKLEELPSKCQWLLEHPVESMRIADAGYQKVSQEYTWEKLILKILRMIV